MCRAPDEHVPEEHVPEEHVLWRNIPSVGIFKETNELRNRRAVLLQISPKPVQAELWCRLSCEPALFGLMNH